MNIYYFLVRNIKWRLHNRLSILVTILQPMLWLIMYSAIASESMKSNGITNYTAFILPGLVVLVSFSACCSSGMMNYLMKNDGSYYRLLIAPVNRLSIISGQLLEGVLCTLFETLIMFLTGVFFGIRINSGLSGCLCIIIIISLSAFSMSGLAYGISLSLPNEAIYETVMNAIVLPVFFLSTALFPLESIHGIASRIIYLNPFTYVINVLRSLILDSSISISMLIKVMLILIVMCMISFYWAVRKLAKQTDY